MSYKIQIKYQITEINQNNDKEVVENIIFQELSLASCNNKDHNASQISVDDLLMVENFSNDSDDSEDDNNILNACVQNLS